MMTPLPPPLGAGEIIGWRIDQADYADSWDSGEGARLYGGRWNMAGTPAVYAALDPATAIMEVAVHKGFRTLDRVPHILTAFAIDDPTLIKLVQPRDVPDPAWLHPGLPAPKQQKFGDNLLTNDTLALLPSVVSTHSWNLMFHAVQARGKIRFVLQEPLVIDARLSGAG